MIRTLKTFWRWLRPAPVLWRCPICKCYDYEHSTEFSAYRDHSLVCQGKAAPA